MNPKPLSRDVIADRIGWIEQMLADLRKLPIHSKEGFFADWRNSGSAESCLRRALEALFDLGRHLLAKGFAVGVSEYIEIAQEMAEQHILTKEESAMLKTLGGYRNRLVHFYHEVSPEELFDICATQLGDVEFVLAGIQRWLAQNQHLLDDRL